MDIVKMVFLAKHALRKMQKHITKENKQIVKFLGKELMSPQQTNDLIYDQIIENRGGVYGSSPWGYGNKFYKECQFFMYKA